MKKIVLVAGGTGGHFFPAVALGEELTKRGYEVHFITDLRCQKYINHNIKLNFHILDLKRCTNIFSFIPELSLAILKAIKLLYSIKPSAILGFGGYPVVSSMFAAILLRIPIIIHEQNSCFGKVNSFFAPFAKKIAISYEHVKNLPKYAKDKIVVTGGVVRKNIRKLTNIKLTKSSEKAFRIFIFGGSQGAKLFSELIPASIEILIQKQPELKLHITQQSALSDQNKVKKIYSKLNITYELDEFFEDMPTRYQNADLVISRAGASTIEELTYIGMPSIFIPLPSAADNHQYYNAQLVEKAGAGWCLEQNNISAEKLADKILELINNPKLLKQTTENLLKRKKEGHELLSDLIEKVI